jgi:hypothetical protein
MKLDPGMHIGLHLVFFGKTGVTRAVANATFLCHYRSLSQSSARPQGAGAEALPPTPPTPCRPSLAHHVFSSPVDLRQAPVLPATSPLSRG